MKTLLFLLLASMLSAQGLQPPAPGQRITVEISSDLVNWTRAMPYNTPRGFIRARTDTCETFADWTTPVDSAAVSGELEMFTGGVRNPNCWGTSFDLTPCCIGEKAGILISPRHVLFSTHWHPDVGATLQWMTAGSVLVERTLTGLVSLPDTPTLFPDLTIGVLDADVAGVSFAKVLASPNNLPEWAGFRVPALIRNQFNQLVTADVSFVTSSIYLTAPLAENRLAKNLAMVSGDSGSPVCVLHDGRLLLISVVTFGGAGRGANISQHADAINAAMTQLGGGYQLTLHTP